MIILDKVMMGRTGSITPAPTDGDTCVQKITYLAVGYPIKRTSADQHADPCMVNFPALVEEAVEDLVMLGLEFWIFRQVVFSDTYGSGAQIVKMALLQAAMLRAAGKPQAISSGMSHLAGDQLTMPHPKK